MMWLNKVLRFFSPPDKILVNEAMSLNLKEVAVFGCGDLGLAIVQRLDEAQIRISSWFDSSIPEGEHRLLGKPIKPASEVVNMDSAAFLIIASEAYAEEIMQQCRNRGFEGRFISLETWL
ncbi:hypothetical protein [Lacimicrobium alkaliphilum]|nr:hypothetical protein [Lacimicrobium alkaliphilum]